MPSQSSSPAKDQPNLHIYHDWAAMQVYYGPRVVVPPYFNSPVASGHPPPHPYMWGPLQPMMPPYGAPYAAIYAHGGVHPHPAVPIGSPAHGHGAGPSPLTSEAMVAIHLSMEAPSKSTANGENGLLYKLKEFNGLALSIGTGNTQSSEDSHGTSKWSVDLFKWSVASPQILFSSSHSLDGDLFQGKGIEGRRKR